MQNNMKVRLSLLFDSSETSMVAFYNGRIIQNNIFLSHVAQARKLLPRHKYSINLCENRYHFLVVFTACASLGQVSLLPNSRVAKGIERLRESYKDNYLVDDSIVEEICNKNINQQSIAENNFQIESEQVVAIVFTSGSTGIPKANPKTWGQLAESAKRVKSRFGFNTQQQHSVVATVPPQHMFGFETTIIYPLILGIAIYAGRPFYLLDIQQALAKMPEPRILVTTPLHLKTCNSEEQGWPDIDFVISATAPMPVDVATEAEKILDTNVFEIYGCSEVGAIATRQMTKNSGWCLLTDYRVSTSDKITQLDVPGYQESFIIPDQLEVYGGCYFRLVGRNSDLINIGGKRGSLNDLTCKLKTIDGVSDAIFVMPDEEEGKRTRLAALVVASNCDVKNLRLEMAKFIDAVFLPRPLIMVQQLPYNEVGKLPRARLLELIKQALDKTTYQEIA